MYCDIPLYVYIPIYVSLNLMSNLTLTLTWTWLYSNIPNYTCFPSPENAIEVKENIIKTRLQEH